MSFETHYKDVWKRSDVIGNHNSQVAKLQLIWFCVHLYECMKFP